MKLYKSYNSNKRDYKNVPQIKIKNEQLENSGFKIGREYAVIYQHGKITLLLVAKKENDF